MNLQGGELCFASQFQNVRPWFLDSAAFGPIVRQYIMVKAHGGRNFFISVKRKSERQKGVQIPTPL
jgi:hypothetical protein